MRESLSFFISNSLSELRLFQICITYDLLAA